MKVWLFLRVGYPKRVSGSYLLAGRDYDRVLGKEIYDEVVEFLRGVENYGFDGIFFPEHHSRAANGLSPSPNIFVAMTAVMTKKIKIGLMGNCLPLHHPVRLGEELALLDNLTNGRLVVGMTRGGDFWAFQIPSAESRERFEEGWDIIQKGWQAEEPFEYHGKYWNLDYVAFLPRPLQQPIPETWIPSISAESIEWAAKNRVNLAASWSPTDQIRESFEYYRKYAKENCGWTPGPDHCVVSRDVYVGETNAKARAEAEKDLLVGPAEEFGGSPAKYSRNVADKYFSERATDYKKGTHVGVMEIKNWSFELLQREGITIVGDPDYVTEQILRQCRTLGTNKIMMRPVFGRLRLHQVKKSLDLMAKEVLPNLDKESIEIAEQPSVSVRAGAAAK
ncbi:MAG TPA: LLM class flavin-dependent oxidoreductase [Candidatus Binatia bacterium]|jgi:alkanesulfonate monooxygenase SsuD/methylene tetrahydromethanopterin reductase-like flavin-dependent oxidoreductase (luciferase family)